MENALDLGSEHCGFESRRVRCRFKSCHGQIFCHFETNVYKKETMHYRLRAIRGGPLGLVNFTPHFIVIQIFQILFLSPVSFYTHPNISDIFVGDEINLFNLTFHDIANY